MEDTYGKSDNIFFAIVPETKTLHRLSPLKPQRGSPNRPGRFHSRAASTPSPTFSIPHAPVDRIEPYGESGKYRIVFSEKAQLIGPIPFGDAPAGTMQGPRYSTFEKLRTAKKLSDVF